MSLPDVVYKLLPFFGFIICATSFLYLDFVFGLSLFYMGFHGVFTGVYSDETEQVQPYKCLYKAVHLHIWCFVDAANLALLIMVSLDQLVSVIWSKTHKDIAHYYFHLATIVCILLGCSVVLVPASVQYSLELAANSSVTVSPYCCLEEVFGQQFYVIQLASRKWLPLAAISLLAITGFALLALQLSQNWNFKWSDNNMESSKFYYYTLIRSVLMAACMHIPIFLFQRTSLVLDDSSSREVVFRVAQALLLGIVQPISNLFVLPRFFPTVNELFAGKEAERDWQGADDPPMPKNTDGKPGMFFGSWYSSTGNIIGEAGVPYELNADKQRSVSFYYDPKNP
uniref:Uncharacterized protein n=1 Tax=Ditylenchus dipsaci TaxID=166011 RepID=A0A915CU57_9BILA